MSFRALLRLVLLPCATLPLYAGWILTRPLAWVAPGTDPALQRIWIGSWAKTALWILGVETRYEGPLPERNGTRNEEPYFMVANHLSYIDILVLLARLDARFLAKSEIAGWPVLGLLARSTGTLFVDRSRKRDLTRVIGEVKAVLGRGTGVIVFPEGTSTDGSQVERFKPSLFEVPVETGVPVRVAALHYESPLGPKPAWEAVCWWGDADFGPHFLTFLSQPRTIATVTFSPELLRAPVATQSGETQPGARKALAEAAHQATKESFTPSRIMDEEPLGQGNSACAL